MPRFRQPRPQFAQTPAVALCSCARMRSISLSSVVRVLELRGPLDDHVDPDPVTNRHLVDEPAKVPLQLRDVRR